MARVRPGEDDVPTEGALLRALVDRVPAMLAYWDAGQRCRFANRAYERWFGVSPEALVGRHMSELLGPLYWPNQAFSFTVPVEPPPGA
ncbi:MAG: PAS domain-containing protein [Planctomycetota bacterium]|nr:PAS domain-containing protein [Planctomycetota bacterium]